MNNLEKTKRQSRMNNPEKLKKQSRMNNPETLATLGRQDSGRTQSKKKTKQHNTTQHKNLKRSATWIPPNTGDELRCLYFNIQINYAVSISNNNLQPLISKQFFFKDQMVTALIVNMIMRLLRFVCWHPIQITMHPCGWLIAMLSKMSTAWYVEEV